MRDMTIMPKIDHKEVAAQLMNVRDQISTNYRRGVGAALAGRTAWGAFNAATLFSSHQMGGGRNSGVDGPSKRFESIYEGGGRDLSVKAFELAKAMTPALN